MRNEKNIEALKSKLLSLGLPGGLEGGLRAQTCLGLEGFALHYRQQREGDTIQITLHFQKDPESMDYQCSFYDARLRRRIEIPPVQVGEVDASQLEQRMRRVNWQEIYAQKFLDDASLAASLTLEQEEAIEAVISDLDRLARSEEGATLATRLKLKFWADTALEGLIPNAGSQKNGLEITQRIYFFDNEEGITLDEAYRFLCHRWREKQCSAQRKNPGPLDASFPDGGNNPGARGKSPGSRLRG
jgi:hypothetical protein